MADLKPREAEPHGIGSAAPRIDPLYLELMRYRVLRSMRSTWWTAFAGLLAVSLAGIGYMHHFVGSTLVEHVRLLETHVESLSRVVSVTSRDRKTDSAYAVMLSKVGDPFVVGMETEFGGVERLIIVGTAFGPDAGQVELFYENRSGGARSVAVTLKGDRIVEWTNSRITVTTTLEEQTRIREQLRVRDFGEVVPYVTVMTAEGRTSPVW